MRFSYLFIIFLGIIFSVLTFVFGKPSLLVFSLLLIVISAFFATKDLLTTNENKFNKGILYFIFHFLLLIWFLSKIGIFGKTVGDLSLILAFTLIIVLNIIFRRVKGKRFLDF